MMLQWNEDDLFYVCTMIEVVARKTHNRSRDVIAKLSDKEGSRCNIFQLLK